MRAVVLALADLGRSARMQYHARALTANGVVMSIYPGLGQDEKGIWTAPGGTAKVAFFSDPDGNGLSLTQIVAR